MSRYGFCAQIARQVGAADGDGLQGAKCSNSRSYCEYLQRADCSGPLMQRCNDSCKRLLGLNMECDERA